MSFGLPVPCPICRSETTERGSSVHGDSPCVAGIPIQLGHHASTLRRCTSCKLLFKHPFVPEEELIACYAESPEDNWEHDPNPRKRRFDTIAGLIEAHAPGKRVLDVGCSNAALLKYLGTNYERFGLEPSASASHVATSRGITMLGGFLEDLDPGARFDAILAIDVLEHLTDPASFMDLISRHLSPGGVLIALTGDHDAWGWRLQGNAYWYAALPEHQVFYCKPTIEHLARLTGMRLTSYRRTSHARQSVIRVLRDTIRGTLYGLAARSGFARGPAPGWLPNRDHMMFVLRGAGGGVKKR
ncbi:MAG: class I SAM-dependent methyltransferase [Phycisphaerales bacterium]